MTLPGNVDTGWVTMKVMDTAGNPAVGKATFKASPTQMRDVSAVPQPVTMFPSPTVVAFDAEGVLPLTEMVATDDPDINPPSWTYSVTFDIQGGSLPGFSFALPSGTTVDLTTVAPVGSSNGVLITQGPAGASAYDEWIAAGNTGTEADFLASLQGEQGPAGHFSSATAHGLPNGDAPTVDLGGTPDGQAIDFGIPAGQVGPSGTITDATASGLPAGDEPTVTLGGTPEARTLAFGIPAGAPGGDGSSAAITDATAHSLAAGVAPTVDLGGTSLARTFDFGIPAGDPGEPGSPGDTGTGRYISVKTFTADHTVDASDANCLLIGNSATALTFTIPAGLGLAVGVSFDVAAFGTGMITLVGDSGVSLRVRDDGPAITAKINSGITVAYVGAEEYWCPGEVA